MTTAGEDVVRTPSPRNPFQKKTRVQIKRQQKGDVVYILCRSEGREEKDRAIRETHEAKLLPDLNKLQQRVAKGRLKKEEKIHRNCSGLVLSIGGRTLALAPGEDIAVTAPELFCGIFVQTTVGLLGSVVDFQQ